MNRLRDFQISNIQRRKNDFENNSMFSSVSMERTSLVGWRRPRKLEAPFKIPNKQKGNKSNLTSYRDEARFASTGNVSPIS